MISTQSKVVYICDFCGKEETFENQTKEEITNCYSRTSHEQIKAWSMKAVFEETLESRLSKWGKAILIHNGLAYMRNDKDKFSNYLKDICDNCSAEVLTCYNNLRKKNENI